MTFNETVSLGVIEKPPGTGNHIILLYDDEQTLISAFSSYYAEGIRRGDICEMAFFMPGLEKKITMEIQKTGLETCDIEKSLSFLHFEEAYFTGKKFTPQKVFGMIDSQLAGLEPGNMLRAGGEMGWVSHELFGEVCSYEKGLSERYGEKNLLIMCAYDSRRMNLSQIIHMVQSHMLILFRENDSWKVSETVERNLYEKKISELEDLKKLAVGRELKMIELKKEIEELKDKKPE